MIPASDSHHRYVHSISFSSLSLSLSPSLFKICFTCSLFFNWKKLPGVIITDRFYKHKSNCVESWISEMTWSSCQFQRKTIVFQGTERKSAMKVKDRYNVFATTQLYQTDSGERGRRRKLAYQDTVSRKQTVPCESVYLTFLSYPHCSGSHLIYGSHHLVSYFQNIA